MTNKPLNKALFQRLQSAITGARNAFTHADQKDKNKLEDVWDVEHAYYSSALEGSNIDKKEFETLAKQTK